MSVWALLDWLSFKWPHILPLPCWSNWRLCTMGSQGTPKSPCLLILGCSQCLGRVGAWERRACPYGTVSAYVLAAAPAELECTAFFLCKDHVHLLCRMGKILFEHKKSQLWLWSYTLGWRGRVISKHF